MSDLGPTQVEIQAMHRRGALVLSAFATIWAAAGISAIGSAPLVPMLWLTAVVVTGLTVVLALRRGTTSAPARPRRIPVGWRRRLGLVNLLQAAGIGLSIALLVMIGRQTLIPAAVCAIVGVHFFPLARIFDESLYAWTGALLLAVSVGGMIVLAAVDGQASRAVVGLGAAAVLWAAALCLSRPTGRMGPMRTADEGSPRRGRPTGH